MKKLLLTILFFIPIVLTAQFVTPDSYQFYVNEEGALCVRCCLVKQDVVLEPLRDTILADGTVSNIYDYSYRECYGYSKPEYLWRFMRFPDSVDMLIPCYAEFHYPTGLKPGLYNFVDNLIKIVEISTNGTPTIEYPDYQALQAIYTPPIKPKPTPPPVATSEPATSSSDDPCTIQVNGKTIPLYGRVQVLEYGADFTVQVLDYGADLQVEQVSYGANSCGQWEFVSYGADFTIEYLPYGADLTIQFVSMAPGMR